MNRSARAYTFVSLASVLAVFFLAGTASAEYEITATIENPGDGTGQVTGNPSSDPILKFIGWGGRSCSGVNKVDLCILRGITNIESKEVSVTFGPPCTAFYYTEFGACQSNGSMYRAVTSAIPSGCVGGSPAVTQSCIYDIRTNTNPILEPINWIIDWWTPPPPAPTPDPEPVVDPTPDPIPISGPFPVPYPILYYGPEYIPWEGPLPSIDTTPLPISSVDSFGVIISNTTINPIGTNPIAGQGPLPGGIPQPDFSYIEKINNNVGFIDRAITGSGEVAKSAVDVITGQKTFGDFISGGIDIAKNIFGFGNQLRAPSRSNLIDSILGGGNVINTGGGGGCCAGQDVGDDASQNFEGPPYSIGCCR